MVNGCHLVTLRLDTALIDDVGRTCAVGGVVQAPQAPTGAAGESWLLASGGGLTPCRARLPGEGGPSLANILLLWFDLDPSELHVGFFKSLGSLISVLSLDCPCTSQGKMHAPVYFPRHKPPGLSHTCRVARWVRPQTVRGHVAG